MRRSALFAPQTFNPACSVALPPFSARSPQARAPLSKKRRPSLHAADLPQLAHLDALADARLCGRPARSAGPTLRRAAALFCNPRTGPSPRHALHRLADAACLSGGPGLRKRVLKAALAFDRYVRFGLDGLSVPIKTSTCGLAPLQRIASIASERRGPADKVGRYCALAGCLWKEGLWWNFACKEAAAWE